MNFSNLFNKAYLGIDIGTTTIKAAEIGKGADGLVLNNYGLLESYGHLLRVGSAIQTSSLKLDNSTTIELITLLMKRMKPSTKSVIASVPGFSGFVTLVDLPDMSEKELASAVGFQAQEHIPLPLDEVMFDWTHVGTIEEMGVKKNHILLVAIPIEIVKSYQEIFSGAGLSLEAIELDSTALVRAVAADDPTPTVLVDIGSRATAIHIVDEGALKMTTSAQSAGSDLTQAIARSMGVDVERAEDLKRTRGLASHTADEELSTLIQPLLDGIIGEVVRAMDIAEERLEKKVERCIVAGGLANMPHIIPYISDQLRIPVVSPAPFKKVQYPTHLEPLVQGLSPLLAVSIGLGVKGFLPH